jgi:hypothetical protein
MWQWRAGAGKAVLAMEADYVARRLGRPVDLRPRTTTPRSLSVLHDDSTAGPSTLAERRVIPSVRGGSARLEGWA